MSKSMSPEVAPTKVVQIYSLSSEKESFSPFYVGRVSAGMPMPVDDLDVQKIDLNQHLMRNPETTFFVRVSGESMIDAGIHPGDLLVVDRSMPPSNGKIVIAVLNGELTVKRLFKEKGSLFLMPENVNYPAIEVTQDMALMIWGVVTNVIHDL